MLAILSGALSGAGMYYLLAAWLHVPSLRTMRAVGGLSKQKKKISMVELWLDGLAQEIAKRLRLNEYKRIQLQSDLDAADLRISPEMHTATALVKGGLCALLAVPVYFVLPLLSPLILILSVLIYIQQARGVQERIRKKREAIEYELPRLVFVIEKTLTHSRDVLGILESYRDNAGPELKRELNITIADMRSGNYEFALARLEARVGSSMLSDVTRGLISMLRGDDTVLYWSSLSIKFADIQRQTLRQQAAKVPGKVSRLSMYLMICYILIYAVVLVSQIMSSIGVMFG